MVHNLYNYGYTILHILSVCIIQKFKDGKEFIKKLCVCDMDFISQEDIITYEYLVQEATR